MARLPIPGKDSGAWGTLLNTYLTVEHNADGTLKNVARPSDVAGRYAKPSTGIPATDLDAATQSKLVAATTSEQTSKKGAPNGYAALDSAGLVPAAQIPATGSTPDATTTTKGVVQLAGDIAGTASAVTVAKVKGVTLPISAPSTGQVLTATSATASSWATPATAPVTSVATRTGAVVLAKTDVGLANVDNTSDATKNSSSATLTNKTISGSSNTLSNIPESAVTNLTTDLAAKANTSSLATVATTGSYTDLSNKPTVPTDANLVHVTGAESIAGVKTFTSAPVVPSGAFPESAIANLTTDLAAKAATASLATVATSGSYNDLSNKPTVPTDANLVHVTGAESIAGIKTFTAAPIVPSSSFPESAVTNLTADLAAKANDTAVVHLTGAESVAGIKTFTSAPVVPSGAFPESAVANLTTDLAAKAATASLATVATTGSYSDLTGKPTLATVATSGSYTDLSNKPTIPAGGASLAPTAVKSSAYTAAVADLIPVDTTSSNVTITLPTAPADKSQIAVKMITGANVVTIAASGSDVFNKSGGSTTLTLSTLNQAMVIQYQASTAIWYVVGDSLSLAALDTRFAPLGAAYKVGLASSGDQVFSGYDLVPNGMPVVAPATITSVLMTNIYPTIGGTQVWRIAAVHANGNEDVITTLTLPDGARAAVVNSLSYAVIAGDVLLVQCTAANGTTYSGLGPSVQIAYGGSQTVRNAPGAPSGLTATPGTSTVALAWAAGTGSTGTLILRDNLPYIVTGNAAYTDTGLSSGTSHAYSIAALVPGNISVITSPVTAGPSTVYTYYSQTDGSLSASDWATSLGTNAGTAAQIASNILTMTSGAVGSNAAQDRVHVDWIKDSGTHTGLRRSWQFGFGTTNAIIDFYFSASSFVNVATSFTSGIQLEMNAASYRIGFKAPSINSGSFNNLTITGSTQATTTASNGTITWPTGITADGAHYYGLMVDLLPTNGDGTQTMNVYFGTTAQQIAGTMPLINTVTFTAAQRTAMAAGYHYLTLLGAQGTGAAQIYKEQAISLTPLTPSGS